MCGQFPHKLNPIHLFHHFCLALITHFWCVYALHTTIYICIYICCVYFVVFLQVSISFARLLLFVVISQQQNAWEVINKKIFMFYGRTDTVDSLPPVNPLPAHFLTPKAMRFKNTGRKDKIVYIFHTHIVPAPSPTAAFVRYCWQICHKA